jgi:hypothetical protein
MTTQSEALRLADWCDANSSGIYRPSAEAAAELRRLHAENERLHQINWSHEMKLSVRGYEIQIADLEAQRDALLEALKRMASIIEKMGDMPDEFIHPSPWRTLKCAEALTQADAAIKAVEEGK